MTDVPVTTELPRVQITASAAQVNFNFLFVILETAQIVVQKTADATGVTTTLTEGVDYNVTIATPPLVGGTVVLTSGATEDDVYTVFRTVPLARLADYSQLGTFRSAAINNELDTMVMKIQELDRDLARAFTLEPADPLAALVMPSVANRASKYLAFDASGNPIGSAGPTGDSGTPVSTFIGDNLFPAVDAAAARAVLATIGLGDVNAFTALQKWAKGADVASATTLTLGNDGNYFDVTGTTTITAIASKGAGTQVKLHFDGALTLTHDATDLILPGGANITTAAGDEAEFVEYATGDWRCTRYQKADGTAVVSPATISVGTEQATTSGTSKDLSVASGKKMVLLTVRGLSTNGTSHVVMRLGDSGGIEDADYISRFMQLASGSFTPQSATSGFGISSTTNSASAVFTGALLMLLANPSTNTWVTIGMFGRTDSGIFHITTGEKSLSAELTTVRFTTVGGVDLLDAGAVNVLAI